jgi:predicted outer membrane repeat protein
MFTIVSRGTQSVLVGLTIAALIGLAACGEDSGADDTNGNSGEGGDSLCSASAGVDFADTEVVTTRDELEAALKSAASTNLDDAEAYAIVVGDDIVFGEDDDWLEYSGYVDLHICSEPGETYTIDASNADAGIFLLVSENSDEPIEHIYVDSLEFVGATPGEGSVVHSDHGAAIDLSPRISMTVRNSVFRDNARGISATGFGGTPGEGPQMDTSITIKGSEFYNTDDEAVRKDSGRIHIEDSHFESDVGPAVYGNVESLGIYVEGSHFEGHSVSDSGGAISYETTMSASRYDPLTVIKSTFKRNVAAGDGAGFTSGGALYSEVDTVVEDSTFEENEAEEGGAIYVDHGSLELSGTSFIDNTGDDAVDASSVTGSDAGNDFVPEEHEPTWDD